MIKQFYFKYQLNLFIYSIFFFQLFTKTHDNHFVYNTFDTFHVLCPACSTLEYVETTLKVK